MDLTSSAASLDESFETDITNADSVAAAVEAFRPTALFHLAGISGAGVAPARAYEVNVMGVVRVLEAVRRHVPACRVLVVGSAAEYGPVDPAELPATETTPCRPAGAYGVSKHAATLVALEYARQFGLQVVVVRPSNIVGAGIPPTLVAGALIARARQALAGGDDRVKVGELDSERDFVAAADAVDAYVKLALAATPGEVFNVCSGRPVSIRHLAETLLAQAPRPLTLEFDPGLVPPSPVRCFYASYEKAARAVGYEPSTPLPEALAEAWRSHMNEAVACASGS
jgi:GDP-4-dehydro-6-deoxy-D-mannose reductase